MVFLNSFKRLIYQFDMFCSSELLRYHQQTQYKTLTGGLFSLAIVCVVAVGFASMVADTLQRATITSSLITQKNSNPPYAALKAGRDQMFMMGFSIQSYDLTFQADLNSGPQYFQVYMTLNQITGGVYTNITRVPLEQCSHEHWSMVPEFNFDLFNVGQWLCLPIGVSLPLQGSYTSSINDQVSIQVVRCSNATSNNSCASQEEIDALFQLYRNFYMSWNYVNPVINANQQDYLSYYTQGNDYIIFSSEIGSQAWVYFSDYTVITDDSILPYQHTTTESGCIVENKAINHPYSVVGNNTLASVYLAKSENSLIYNRQVQKISAVFSYIGGLIGAITAVLFLMKSYTDTSLQVTVGLSLFEVNKEKQNQKKEEVKEKGVESDCEEQKEYHQSFNFFVFVRLACYRLLCFFGWIQRSENEDYLQECQKEALKQMDIQLLLKRIIKLETCMSHLFTVEQLQKIKDGQLITLKRAQKMRTLLLRDDESNNAQNQNQIVIKDQAEFNDLVFESDIVLGGRSAADSITSIHRNSLDKPTDPIIIGKQQKYLREPSRGILGTKEQTNITFETGRNDQVLPNLKAIHKDGSINRVCPDNQSPPKGLKGFRFFVKN